MCSEETGDLTSNWVLQLPPSAPSVAPPVPELPPTISLSIDRPDEVVIQKDGEAEKVDEEQQQPKATKIGRLGRMKKDKGAGAEGTTTPAAALALAASKPDPSQTTPEVKFNHLKNARLTLDQCQQLCDLCAKEIRMRGLATVGIFRPFRTTESLAKFERLVELFLLAVEPKTYEGVFPLSDPGQSSTLLPEGVTKTDAHTELSRKLSYANIHDVRVGIGGSSEYHTDSRYPQVVALLKWGLRRLRLKATDFYAVSSEPLKWYDSFVQKEKAASYPKQAYSDLLLPKLPSATGKFLSSLLDLMTTVSAHHVANAMPASRLCKTLGYWIVGRIGVDHPPHSFDEVVKAWSRASAVTEHLFLAFTRDQTSRIHLMPTRLTELIADYPHVAPGAEAPSLGPAFTFAEKHGLRVDVRSENIVVSPKRIRGPSESLRAALKAQNPELESSEELDDWSAILGVAFGATAAATNAEADGEVIPTLDPPHKETEDEIDARKEFALLREEDASVLRLVAAELAHRKAFLDGTLGQVSDGGLSTANSATSFLSDLTGADAFSSSTHASSDNLTDFGFGAARGGYSSASSTHSASLSSLPAGPTASRHGSLRAKQPNLGPLLEDAEKSLDWSNFAKSGFGESESTEEKGPDLRLDESLRPKTDLERAFDEEDQMATKRKSLSRTPSFGTLRRNRSGAGRGSRANGAGNYFPNMPPPPPTFSLTKVDQFSIDEVFASVWQDQLLDPSLAASFPNIVLAQLNQTTASRLLALGSGAHTTSWLCICETVIPPRPPLPPSSASSGPIYGSYSFGRRRSSTDIGGNDDGASERRSIFAPSLRSIGTSIFRKRPSLRRVSSLWSTRGGSSVALNGGETIDKDSFGDLNDAGTKRKGNAVALSRGAAAGGQGRDGGVGTTSSKTAHVTRRLTPAVASPTIEKHQQPVEMLLLPAHTEEGGSSKDPRKRTGSSGPSPSNQLESRTDQSSTHSKFVDAEDGIE